MVARFTATARAYLHGVADGYRQPHSLGSSTNVDHLAAIVGDAAHDTLDLGINHGQALRAGRAAESIQQGFRMTPSIRRRATTVQVDRQTLAVLIEHRIEDLDYKTSLWRDYDDSDVAGMRAEIGRLTRWLYQLRHP